MNEMNEGEIEKLRRKLIEDMRPIPFGWSRQQFLKWLRQEPYRRTGLRWVMDMLWSLGIGGLGGYSITTAVIKGNILYLFFALPAIIFFVVNGRSLLKYGKRIKEITKVTEMKK